MSEIVVFHLDGSRYALPLSRVVELLHMVAPTPLPGSGSMVEGIVNVRGRILPLLDIRSRFGLSQRPPAPDDHLVAARRGDRDVLLRVDRVEGIRSVDESAVHPMDEVGAKTPHVAGAVSLSDGLVLIHDLDAFLSEAEDAELTASLEALERGNE